ncbi:hypothetical protein EKX87_09785 [Salmonella enterica]|uniref:Uncharacterized protein n=1 Tax=Salmonella enterica TaxID=28901 RepID=A0A5T3RAT3_SALER|nr:hypothetical protein [Salmonella enterica]
MSFYPYMLIYIKNNQVNLYSVTGWNNSPVKKNSGLFKLFYTSAVTHRQNNYSPALRIVCMGPHGCQ